MVLFKFRILLDKALQQGLSDIRDDFYALLYETTRSYSIAFRERLEKEDPPDALKRVTEGNPPARIDKDLRKDLLDALTAIRRRVEASSAQDAIEAAVMKRYSHTLKHTRHRRPGEFRKHHKQGKCRPIASSGFIERKSYF